MFVVSQERFANRPCITRSSLARSLDQVFPDRSIKFFPTARSSFPRPLDQVFPDHSIKFFPTARSSLAAPLARAAL